MPPPPSSLLKMEHFPVDAAAHTDLRQQHPALPERGYHWQWVKSVHHFSPTPCQVPSRIVQQHEVVVSLDLTGALMQVLWHPGWRLPTPLPRLPSHATCLAVLHSSPPASPSQYPTHVFLHTHSHTYMHTRTWLHTHTNIHPCTRTHIARHHLHICICLRTHTYAHMCLQIYTHADAPA